MARPARSLALMACLAVVPQAQLAAAQGVNEISGAPMVSESQWREMVSGRAVDYEIGGEFWAREFYGADNSVEIYIEGRGCMAGEWFMQGPAFCFVWQGQPPDCFHHHRLGARIFVLSVIGGTPTGEVQEVTRISSSPAICGPDLLSQLSPHSATNSRM